MLDAGIVADELTCFDLPDVDDEFAVRLAACLFRVDAALVRMVSWELVEITRLWIERIQLRLVECFCICLNWESCDVQH